MNLNPIWKAVASVGVVVSLAWSQMEPAAFAQAPAVEKTETTERQAKAVQSGETVAPAKLIAMASAPAGAASQARPAAASKSKKKWWVLIGIAAAATVTAVLVSRGNSGPSITVGPPVVE